MDFGYHFIDVILQFVDSFLFQGRDEDAGYLPVIIPFILYFLQSLVALLLWLQREFVVLYVLVGICFIEYHEQRFVAGSYVF